MKALSLFRFTQKGAMFGLDGRIALVIFASISTIAGASIFFNRLDAQATVLHGELKALHEAIKTMQSDFENDLYASLDNTGATRHQNALNALFDETQINATHQNNWHGPYIDEFIQPGTRIYKALNNVEGVTTVTIQKHPKMDAISNADACSNADPCYYWVRIRKMPLKVIQKLNDRIDGSGETTPEDEGRVQWNDDGSAEVVNLWYITEQALNNTNGSVGL